MLIEQKVKLSKSAAMKSVLVGVKEAHFVRFYNESLFLWQQWVRQQGGVAAVKGFRETGIKTEQRRRVCRWFTYQCVIETWGKAQS
ncbi:hypothetical protein SKA34_08418 [Photobacterium sp. SKA34]|uniref:hypothetical protein n=1 Tax=Photobacterium sp. SKA34 TaxID=121723 RepID=UPI00006B417E|nr:hypothetical protein [Photobacterium sp. SKA34]EAR57596.1 hypothetical protein SKA34_08418 [Photobacterium sp. SKA34]